MSVLIGAVVALAVTVTLLSRVRESRLRVRVERRSLGKAAGEPGAEVGSPWTRKSRLTVLLYEAGISLLFGTAVGFGMLLFVVFDNTSRPVSVSRALPFILSIFGIPVALIAFVIQAAGRPFVLSREVVCRECHWQQRADRIEFFGGRYRGPPRCGRCGGKFEPAILWRPN